MAYFEGEWNKADDFSKMERLEKEKRAIMGFEEEMAEYQEKISEIIEILGVDKGEYPGWYPSLTEGVFSELYGLSSLYSWVYDKEERLVNSSSAKVIGDKVFFLIDGVSELQPQCIKRSRREQLKRAFLMATPKERLERGFHEIYLRNGIRITIYSGDRTKEGEDVMVFRKYIVRKLTFEEQAALGTIPEEGIDLFKSMVEIGFNVIFSGAVRSGKTTFLQTWQSYEREDLEGLAISTDPETPWHKIMPKAPIMQLVADGEELENITKSILRGDNDYVLLEEMRDGVAFNIALDIVSTGTKRSKATVHTKDALNLPYKMGTKICSRYGGSFKGILQQIFINFDFVFEFAQVEENRGKKLLKGIWLYGYDKVGDKVFMEEMLRYDGERKEWVWRNVIGADFELRTSKGYDKALLERLKVELDVLEKSHSMENPITLYPSYYKDEEGFM